MGQGWQCETWRENEAKVLRNIVKITKLPYLTLIQHAASPAFLFSNISAQGPNDEASFPS